jgi:hypothetical protein
VPSYRVEIHGDPARGAGLLAVQGIQSLIPNPDAQELAARLSASDAETAVARVQSALEGEPCTVGDAREESADRRA